MSDQLLEELNDIIGCTTASPYVIDLLIRCRDFISGAKSREAKVRDPAKESLERNRFQFINPDERS